MNPTLEKLIESLALKLPEGKANESLEPEYEMMSGAFIWKDECPDLPELSKDEVGCLRSIWRYRTSLATGIEDNRFSEMWALLKRQSPNWIGFSDSRCTYSDKLARRYLEIKGKKR
jgi:hypothetical protein